MTFEISNIIKTLKENEEYKLSVQSKLRSFILDKSNPLDKRFDIWSEYCEKDHSCYLPHGEIGKLIRTICLYDDLYVERRQTLTYDDMLDKIYDEEDNDGNLVISNKNLSHFPSYNEFRELLIEDNLGSFNYDW